MTAENPRARPVRRALRTAQQGGWRLWAPWVAAFVVFVIDIQTAPEVYDIEHVEGGLLPIVAAGAAVPVGLITRRPLVGWLISALSALTFSQTFPILDGDPWPWPPVHGLVVLALLFSLVALRPPLNLPPGREIVLKVAAWIATAALFGTLTDDHAGWVVAVTAVAAAGLVARWLTITVETVPRAEGVRPAEAWVVDLRRSLRAAFVEWTRTPGMGRPLGQRWFGDPEWLQWFRAAGPWLLAFGLFWIALADVDANLVVHALVLPVLCALIALPAGLIRDRIIVGWRIATLLGLILALVATPAEDASSGVWPVSFQWVWVASIFFVSVHHDRWTTVWVWLTSVLVMSAGVSADASTGTTLIVFSTALVFVGDLIRSRIQAARSLEQQTELSQLEKARRTVLEEKARIARDLHDIVAHHMSMVVVQAETAPYRVAGLSGPAKSELESISASAREALGEIRSLLGVLRSETDDASYTPQPGVGELHDLVDTARRSGVDVRFEVLGQPSGVSSAIALSAYRIVQESLANAARHAPGASVTVSVGYRDNVIDVRVSNEPSQSPTPPGPPGHGIVGMRERAAVVGGTLRASPSQDGGFTVIASLPMSHEEEQA